MNARSEEFEFFLSQEEKRYLKDLVRLCIVKRLQRKGVTPLPDPPSQRLDQPFGAFVTLRLQGQLRGCIGRLDADAPLRETIARMAQAAAFEDSRFPPLLLEELEDLSVEISILSPIEPCPDVRRIEVGRHGLVIRKGGRSGLLLPQVPVEWRWSREEFLQQTCRKAGLPADAWRESGTEILWFEAEVF